MWNAMSGIRAPLLVYIHIFSAGSARNASSVMVPRSFELLSPTKQETNMHSKKLADQKLILLAIWYMYLFPGTHVGSASFMIFLAFLEEGLHSSTFTIRWFQLHIILQDGLVFTELKPLANH